MLCSFFLLSFNLYSPVLYQSHFSSPCSLFFSICFRNTSPCFHNHHVYIRPSLSPPSLPLPFLPSSHLCSSCFLFFVFYKAIHFIQWLQHVFKLFNHKYLCCFIHMLKSLLQWINYICIIWVVPIHVRAECGSLITVHPSSTWCDLAVHFHHNNDTELAAGHRIQHYFMLRDQLWPPSFLKIFLLQPGDDFILFYMSQVCHTDVCLRFHCNIIWLVVTILRPVMVLSITK